MSTASFLQLIILLFSVVLHEVAHGATARSLGDPTAQLQGRLTLNPLKHIDPIGSIMLPLFLLVTHSPFLFGWAKPVPYNPHNLQRGGRFAEPLVALAGPLTNGIIALVFALLVRASFFPSTVLSIAVYAVFINILLMVFNLIPIPPLDGSKVVPLFLPARLRLEWRHIREYLEYSPWSFAIVFALLMVFSQPFFIFILSLTGFITGIS